MPRDVGNGDLRTLSGYSGVRVGISRGTGLPLIWVVDRDGSGGVYKPEEAQQLHEALGDALRALSEPD